VDFRGLESDALEGELLGLRRQERRLAVEVLHGLIEVERRRLHLDRGYGSLFAYCVERLGYCESSAGRRIAAARALRNCPRLEGMLLAGEVHVSTVAMAAKAIAKDERVLDRIRGKTQRQVEEILAEPDGVRELRFAAGPAVREKFERVRSLLSGKQPEGVTPEQVLEAALDEYLERNDPTRNRRSERSPRGSGRRSRSIPAGIRRAVQRRDGGRCTYVGSQGRRCGSTWDVELDHVNPYCRGGEHRVENLRLLCSAHNRREAERMLGTAWMAPFQRRE
jgi:5-methylcytosine-specific restriction endonuclease McrA